VLAALFGAATPTGTVFDSLADYIGQHFEPGVLDVLIHLNHSHRLCARTITGRANTGRSPTSPEVGTHGAEGHRYHCFTCKPLHHVV
jgi:hypothetical protein